MQFELDATLQGFFSLLMVSWGPIGAAAPLIRVQSHNIWIKAIKTWRLSKPEEQKSLNWTK